MAERMPPPGGKKPGVMVGIAIKPKGGDPSSSRMPPPGEADEQPGAESDPAGGSGKHSAEEAHVVRENQHCKDCVHWQPETGECSEVDGSFAPEDACIRDFKAGGQEEPDADESGGMPDGDQDDQMAPEQMQAR